jgi:hypothetical protein
MDFRFLGGIWFALGNDSCVKRAVKISDLLQESLADQFVPDILLPVQYYDLMRRRNRLEGAHRLALAVLEDAVECYLKNMNAKSRQRRILFYEVQNWMNDKNRVGMFSYETLCETVGLDAKSLRTALKRQLKRQPQNPH